MNPLDSHDAAPTDLDVPFDDRAGCGVILERLLRGEHSLIGITFVTRLGAEPAHDLTLDQATLLAAQITAAISQARPTT